MPEKIAGDVLDRVVARWDLQDLTPMKQAAHASVWRCRKGAQACVLKIGQPKDSAREIAALTAYADHGGVPIVVSDVGSGAFLMKDLVPGTPLATYFPDRDHAAVQVAARLMQRLHQAPVAPGVFPKMMDWLAPLWASDVSPEGIPAGDWAQARVLAAQLMTYTGPEVLLHGDLHHDNILWDGADWCAVDPHGVQGEAGWDVACFMRNPIAHIRDTPDLPHRMRGRLEAFATRLQAPPQRLADMSFVGAMLAAAWAVQDGTPAAHWCLLARAIRDAL